jgi:F0F1-type ATP synthase gamma subunit
MPVRKTVNVPVSTDKGMCGGINTQIAKLANACTAVDSLGAHLHLSVARLVCLQPLRMMTLCEGYVSADKEKETRLMCVGSKGVNPVKRANAPLLDGVAADYSKNTITFALVRCSGFLCPP